MQPQYSLQDASGVSKKTLNMWTELHSWSPDISEGTNKNPTYKNHAEFGHREAVRIEYETSKISYEKLLKIFWRTSDPTDPDGQFCDRGNAYTTAIYTLNDKQTEIAEKSKRQAQKDLGETIVTPIIKASEFTPSEEYHQDYYRKNPLKYAFYRRTCGRDRNVEKLWGEQAYWKVKGH